MTYPHPGTDAWESYKDDDMDLSVVHFFAPWCASCKIMSPGFDNAMKANPDVKSEKINVDLNPGRAFDEGIFSIPATAFYKNGARQYTHIGAMSEGAIEDKIFRMRKREKNEKS